MKFKQFFCDFKTKVYICSVLHFEKGEKARQITLLRAFFMLWHCLFILLVPTPVWCL